MIKAVNLIKRFNDTVFQYRKILIIFFNERMVTIMGKNGNIKKALATNNNDNLYRIAELIESVHLNAVCEFDAMTEWDTVHHFDAVKKSGTSKNAYQYDIDKYESLKAERSAYRESLPFVANYKADNIVMLRDSDGAFAPWCSPDARLASAGGVSAARQGRCHIITG